MGNDAAPSAFYNGNMPKRIGRKNPGRVRTFLKEWREHRGHSQEELAEIIGTTKVSISRYETGERTPTLDFMVAAAEALHCELHDILTRSPDVLDIRSLLKNETLEKQRVAFEIVKSYLKAG